MTNEFKSPPPNPKDYPSFEDYERAVKRHEEFVGMCKDVDEAMARTKTEEEFNREMEKLGFTCHEDEYCENEWCQKNEECLAFSLDAFQDASDEYFFWKMMPKELKIMHIKLEGDDCNLLESWKSPDTKEGKSIRFCLAVHDALVFENAPDISFVELVKQKTVQDFGRTLYLFLQKILMTESFPIKEAEEIQEFLNKNNALKPKVSSKLLKMLEAISKKL